MQDTYVHNTDVLYLATTFTMSSIGIGTRHWYESLPKVFYRYSIVRWPHVSQWLLPATVALTAPEIHVFWCHEDVGPGVHFMLPGLLQLTVLQHIQWIDNPAAVCLECCCTYGVGRSTARSHHAGATPVALASAIQTRNQCNWVDFKMASLIYNSQSSIAPVDLATGCQLTELMCRRKLLSADSRTCIVNFGDWCFTAAGPKLYNSLPAGLRQTDIGC